MTILRRTKEVRKTLLKLKNFNLPVYPGGHSHEYPAIAS
jgi:hypothetical protein